MNILTKAGWTDDVSRRERENLRVAYQAACESIVLLKNDGVLPFTGKKVALFGPGVSMTIKGGTGSGEVNERHSVNILEGMEDRGFEVTSKDWISRFEDHYRQKQAEYQEEKKRRVNLLKLDSIMNMLFDNFRFPDGPEVTEEDTALDAELCVYVLSRQAGEGGDRKVEPGDFLLTEGEEKTIRLLAHRYEKFVVAINCGSAMDMSVLGEIPGVNAILYLCQLGTEGGHAFADVISGAVSPSGKLSSTWAKRYEDVPFANDYGSLNGDLQQEYYKEGIYVGYRYYDSFGVEPAYPFGYGLSYTEFSIVPEQIKAEGTVITAECVVTNTGSRYSGKETVQLYVSAPNGRLHKELQSLAAFGKTKVLAPGECQRLTLSFDLKDVSSYRESDGCYVLEPGEYLLRVGNSSRNLVTGWVVALNGEAIVSRHEHICPVRQRFGELQTGGYARAKRPDVPVITVDASVIQTKVYTYEQPSVCDDKRVQKWLSRLSEREMTDIVVGAGMFGGDHRFNLPGSVGNTTSKFWSRGLANVTLCDGPAGLRIQRRSTVSKSGKVKPVDAAMSIFDAFPDFVKKFTNGDPEKEPVLYQYTTAFPVSHALAQTWNTELMYHVGNAVYREMKEYGCTFWLAPAVNIHRNPLCGRNFEYFSEDPFLTGAMASAVIRGVQQERGFYVTVKHFACNNQEDNRTFVSSNLSERALREIYLRGFERCVRSGGAKGIMTSYNKVNGVYSPNSYDLCTRVLRNEWGFDGVVMTDWFSTNKGQADNALAIKAGNDLIMPGSGANKQEILNGLKSNVITLEELRRCCGNVLKAILNSAIQREYIE